MKRKPFDMLRGVFVPLDARPWAIRQAVCASLRAGEDETPFRLAQEEHYYPGMLERTLCDAAALSRLVPSSEGGTLGCVALWDLARREGVAIGRRNGRLFATWLPLISLEQAVREGACADALADLAALAKGVHVQLVDPIAPGRYALAELLAHIAAHI